MSFQTQRQPVEFQIVFQLGLRDLGVGISLMLLRSVAPLSWIKRSFSSYSLLLWKTKMRKDTNLQKKVYCKMNYLGPPNRIKKDPTISYRHSQIENSIVPSLSCRIRPANVHNP